MEQQQLIDRRGSGSLKWDVAGKDELPLWVADMDFASPRVALDAVRRRLEHPILGYARVDAQTLRAFAGWCERRQGWKPDPAALVMTAGMLHAIGLALQVLTPPGAKVVVQTPVYAPFSTIPPQAERSLLVNPLIRLGAAAGNPYRMDLYALRELFEREKPAAMVLCSPHNPVGRVWTREELELLVDACQRHGVLLVADEIHADLALPGRRFVSVGELAAPGGRFAEAPVVVLQSPSKTFNIPGLPSCLAYAPRADLRQRLRDGISALGQSTVNVLSAAACEAAYGGADAWMDEVLGIIDTNRRLLRLQVEQWRQRWPRWAEAPAGLELTDLEGTYLAWLRVRPIQDALAVDSAGLQAWLRKNARVYLSHGGQFGPEGDGFLRINIATHETILTEALERLQRAFDGIYEA